MKPLEGIKVVDFTQAHAGSLCTMLLADFGAEVIKIERPGYGDLARTWSPFKNDASGYYAYLNRGKKSIGVNGSTEEGRKILLDLIKDADVVTENFKYGSMDRMGLSYEKVREINPEIIYASLNGYGQNGPWSGLAAYDNVIQAMCGMMEMTGFAGDVPTKVGPAVGDNFTGLTMALAIVMAYYHKLNTGRGQYLDVSMMDCLFGIMESPILYKELLNEEISRCGNADPTLTPYDVYPCKDGYFSAGLPSESGWDRFCDAIEMPELIEDPRFTTNELRVKNYDVVTPLISEFFKKKTKAELIEIFNAHNIPNSPVNTIPELMHNEQLKARNMLIEAEDDGVGRYLAMGNPMIMDQTPAVIGRGAPAMGRDTDRVLGELGYSASDIAALREREAI